MIFGSIRNYNIYISKLLVVLLYTFVINGCKIGDLCEGEGESLTCLDSGGLIRGSYCTGETDATLAPCECYLEEYDSNTDKIILVDVMDRFTTTCDFSGGSNGFATEVDQPYEFDCPSIFSGNLCTQYETYYFDLTSSSYDDEYRPIYVKFDISDFSLKDYNYEFQVSKEGSNNVIFSTDINSDNITTSSAIRKMNPNSCDDVCDMEGVMKLNVNSISSAGTYNIVMLQVDVNDPSVISNSWNTSFEVERYEGSSQFEQRTFQFVLYKTNDYDPSTGYFIGPQPWSQHLFNNVFGNGRANLKLGSFVKPIDEKHVNALSNIILDSEDFGGFGEDVSNALREWTKRVYITNSSSTNYDGFTTEVYFAFKFDVSQDPPVQDTAADPLIEAEITGQGQTIARFNENDFFAGSIVFRYNIENLLRGTTVGSQIDIREFSTKVFLHEIGHMWYDMGNNGTSCERHTSLCTGKNKYNCLWQGECIGQPDSDNPLSIDNFVLAAIDRPTFCEGHQQAFMNKLRARE